MSVSLRGRRSEEITQSNTSSPRESEVPLESKRGVTAIEVPQNEDFWRREEWREKRSRFYHPLERSG